MSGHFIDFAGISLFSLRDLGGYSGDEETCQLGGEETCHFDGERPTIFAVGSNLRVTALLFYLMSLFYMIFE